MLTNEEAVAVINDWNKKSARGKAAVVKKAERLRAAARAAPPFHSVHLETWRTRSLEVSELFAEDELEGTAPAFEAAMLEKLFSSSTVKAWERAFQIIQMGLSDPLISAEPGLQSLFRDLLDGIDDLADYPHVSLLVQDYLVTPEIETQVISRVGRRNGKKPHINHEKASQNLPVQWEKMRLEGKSKSQAAPLIAGMLGLSSSTVRRKLQGL